MYHQHYRKHVGAVKSWIFPIWGASVVRVGIFCCFQLKIILVYDSKVVIFNGAKTVTYKCFFFAHQRENGGFCDGWNFFALLSVTLVWDDQISHFQVARKQATYLIDTAILDLFILWTPVIS